MKKIQRNEMKKLGGGAPPPPFRTLWRCEVEPGYFENICYPSQPQTVCGYAQPCANIGTCTKLGGCIY
jgi:hypothetical protein